MTTKSKSKFNNFICIILYGITPPQIIVVSLLHCNTQTTNSYIQACKGMNIIAMT